jgi:hypothetical protein
MVATPESKRVALASGTRVSGASSIGARAHLSGRAAAPGR